MNLRIYSEVPKRQYPGFVIFDTIHPKMTKFRKGGQDEHFFKSVPDTDQATQATQINENQIEINYFRYSENDTGKCM